MGGIGGTKFTPIINCPEVAILGVSRASMQPVYNKSSEDFEARLMLPLSLSYDHRVVDGADGARFTSHLCMMLSDVRRLLTIDYMAELKKIHIPNIGDFDSVEVIEVMVQVGDEIKDRRFLNHRRV